MLGDDTVTESATQAQVERVVDVLATAIDMTQREMGYNDADILSAFFTLTGVMVSHICRHDARNVPKMEEAIMGLLAKAASGGERVQ